MLARINQNRSRKRASTYSLPEWPLFSWKNLISRTPSGESLEIIIWCLDSSGKGALLSRPPTRSTPPIRTGLNFARQLDFFTQPPFLMVSISSGNAFLWSNIISSLSASLDKTLAPGWGDQHFRDHSGQAVSFLIEIFSGSEDTLQLISVNSSRS